MDIKFLNFNKDPNFVAFPYAQSKRVYEEVVEPIDEANNFPIPLKDNPFAIQYSNG